MSGSNRDTQQMLQSLQNPGSGNLKTVLSLVGQKKGEHPTGTFVQDYLKKIVNTLALAALHETSHGYEEVGRRMAVEMLRVAGPQSSQRKLTDDENLKFKALQLAVVEHLSKNFTALEKIKALGGPDVNVLSMKKGFVGAIESLQKELPGIIQHVQAGKAVATALKRPGTAPASAAVSSRSSTAEIASWGMGGVVRSGAHSVDEGKKAVPTEKPKEQSNTYTFDLTKFAPVLDVKNHEKLNQGMTAVVQGVLLTKAQAFDLMKDAVIASFAVVIAKSQKRSLKLLGAALAVEVNKAFNNLQDAKGNKLDVNNTPDLKGYKDHIIANIANFRIAASNVYNRALQDAFGQQLKTLDRPAAAVVATAPPSLPPPRHPH